MKISRTIEVEGEKVHLAKDWLGWRVVHPNKNEDGSINWFNLLFGGKANLTALILIAIIAAIFLFGINEMFDSCRHLANNLPEYCHHNDVTSQINELIKNNISLPYYP